MSKKEDFISDVKMFAKASLKKYFSKEKFQNMAMLNDGQTQIVYEEDVLATGVIVSIMDTQGNSLPLPAGNYTLEDGATFDIVDDLGTADNVVLVEVPADAEETGEMDSVAPAAPAVQPKTTIETVTKETHFSKEEMKELEDLKVKFAALEKENETLKSAVADEAKEKETFSSELENVKGELTETKGMVKSLFEMVEKIGSEPASEPTDKKKPSLRAFDVAAQKAAFKADLRR